MKLLDIVGLRALLFAGNALSVFTDGSKRILVIGQGRHDRGNQSPTSTKRRFEKIRYTILREGKRWKIRRHAMMDEKNNARLLQIGDKLRNEREQQLREVADLKNAKDEMRRELERIGGYLKLTWTHPREVSSAVESMVARFKIIQADRDERQEVMTKIFRMCKGVGPVTSEEVLAAVYRFTAPGMPGEDLRQQLEEETAANVALRKELEQETARVKFARESATAIKEEARIAQQTAEHWRQQAQTTETALRRLQNADRDGVKRVQDDLAKARAQLETVGKERARLERECMAHRSDIAKADGKFAASQDTVRRLSAEIEDMKARQVLQPTTSPSNLKYKSKYTALRGAVMKALRDGMELVKAGGVADSKDNSARYNSAFNKGMRAGASIVEVEIYSALPPEE